MEVDVEVFTKALLVEDVSHPEFGLVLNDVLVLVTEFLFFFCNFNHIKHLGNLVSHFLARRSKSGSELQVWIEFIPDNIAHLVTRDYV